MPVRELVAPLATRLLLLLHSHPAFETVDIALMYKGTFDFNAGKSAEEADAQRAKFLARGQEHYYQDRNHQKALKPSVTGLKPGSCRLLTSLT